MNNMIATPFLSKVKIDFDPDRKVFFLSAPIFYSPSDLPHAVKTYVEKRENHSFNPYKTFFKVMSPCQVNLVQELPFQWGFQPSFREQVHAFRKLAAQSHHILLEIAIEENLSKIEEHLFDALLSP